jgi:hypothetical protein
MAFAGLVASQNLSDVSSAEIAWDNIGDGITYFINNTTVSGITIKGADILALNGVSRVSARDLLLLQGLTSAAQPRLTTIASQVGSGVVLQSNALLKASPTSIGNYSLNGSLSVQSLSINGVGAKSLSTSPFSGGSAIANIYLDTAIVGSGVTIQNAITSGTITAPEIAIPIEEAGYIYYLKAGQS